MNLRENLPFGRYQPDSLNNGISVYSLGFTVLIEESVKHPEFNGKILNVQTLNSKWISPEKSNNVFDFELTKYRLYFQNKEVDLNEVLTELQYKNGKPEFDKLFYAKIKDNIYLSNYEFGLFHFFKKNEENFFLLQDCLVGDFFCFPKHEEDKKRLLEYVNEKNPQLAKLLEQHAFSYEELNNKKTLKR